jgi:hypothetical protein
MSSPSTLSSKNTPVTKKSGRSGAYDPNFQQILVDNGVFPYGYEYPDGQRPRLPGNWDEINRRLAQPRPSLSLSTFPDKKYEAFKQANVKASSEDAVKDSVLPAILRTIDGTNSAQKNKRFTNLAPLTEKGNELKDAQPDYYCGAQPEQLHQDVRNELSKQIIPSSSTNLPIVPNFFLEAKAPDGSAAVMGRQACYDGALGARAIQSLQSYGRAELVFDNNGYTISSTYHDGTLKIYSHHIALPNGPGTRPEYYMHQIKTWGMTGGKDTFLDGAKVFRNAEDWAQEHRNTAIARANEIAGLTFEDEEGGETDDEGEECQTMGRCSMY